MKEMILLGAGASKEAGVPDSNGMTREISKRFHQEDHLKQLAHVISFIIGGLLFQKGILGEDPLDQNVNVEELFNAVQLLANRDSLETAPFIGSWHPMVQEFDKITSNSPSLRRASKIISSMDSLMTRFPRDTDSSAEIERELTLANRELAEHSGSGQVFQNAADRMIETLADIVWIESADRVSYLNPLLNLLEQQGSLTIATLNYDNAVELLAQTATQPWTTGFEEWSMSGSFPHPRRGLLLLKIHGSIDWALDERKRSDKRPMPRSTIRQISPKQVQQIPFTPAVIFGQRNKLTAEGPFLDLLRAFKQELKGSERLTVVGYSFRDPHINEYISQWLNESTNHRLRVVNLQGWEKQSKYAGELIQYCSNRVDIITKGASEGLAEVYLQQPLNLVT
jgi:SIR2-like domain